ncbi:MAG: hypothetical protein V4692_13470 [Bdellovibrionota bacterium]
MITNIDQIAFLYAFAEVGESQTKAIIDNLSRRAGGSSLEPMSFQSGEFYRAGKPSGVRIISYQPFNIEYKGKIWSFDKSQSAEQNYLSLLKTLESKSTVQISFLSEAHAISDADSAHLGALAAVVVIGVAAVFVAPVGFPVAIITVGGAMLGGALAGVEIGKKHNQRKSILNIDAILRSDFTLVCERNEVALKVIGRDFEKTLKLEKRNGSVKYSQFGDFGNYEKVAGLSSVQHGVFSSLSTCNKKDSVIMAAKIKKSYATVATTRRLAAPKGTLLKSPSDTVR